MNSSGHDPLRFSNGRFLFGADDGSTGKEPWVSDGSMNGTQRIKDVIPDLGIGYFLKIK